FGAIDTTPGPTRGLGNGTALNDSATLQGTNPTGTITFQLFTPGGTLVYTDVVTLTGAAAPVTVNTLTDGNKPGGFVPTTAVGAGQYQWVVTYSGDQQNPMVTSPSGAEPQAVVNATISISPQTPVNEVKHSETFTITVTAFPAGTGVPSFSTPTVTFP